VIHISHGTCISVLAKKTTLLEHYAQNDKSEGFWRTDSKQQVELPRGCPTGKTAKAAVGRRGAIHRARGSHECDPYKTFLSPMGSRGNGQGGRRRSLVTPHPRLWRDLRLLSSLRGLRLPKGERRTSPSCASGKLDILDFLDFLVLFFVFFKRPV
jgi:hypothetical protein